MGGPVASPDPTDAGKLVVSGTYVAAYSDGESFACVQGNALRITVRIKARKDVMNTLLHTPLTEASLQDFLWASLDTKDQVFMPGNHFGKLLGILSAGAGDDCFHRCMLCIEIQCSGAHGKAAKNVWYTILVHHKPNAFFSSIHSFPFLQRHPEAPVAVDAPGRQRFQRPTIHLSGGSQALKDIAPDRHKSSNPGGHRAPLSHAK